MILPLPRGCTKAKQSPPIPVDCGSITPRRAQAATAASARGAPDCMPSMAVGAASGCDVATMPFCPWTVDRPARWKFLMPDCSLDAVLQVAELGLGAGGRFLAYSCGAGQCLKTRGSPSNHVPARCQTGPWFASADPVNEPPA